MGRGLVVAAVVRGDVWWVDLDPVVGHEQGRRRPAVVVSADAFTTTGAELVIIVPLTRTDRRMVLHVRIDPPEENLSAPSFAMTEQIRTVSTLRLGSRLGAVAPPTLRRIERRLGWLLGL